MKKTKSFPLSLAAGFALAAVLRIILILIFSLFAYLTENPGDSVALFALLCRATSDILTGFIISQSLGKDFSLGTRIFLSVASVILFCISELLLGKLVFPSGDMNLYMLPISLLSALFGALITRKAKTNQRTRRKRR